MYEDIADSVSVADHQVRCVGDESHEATIRANRRRNSAITQGTTAVAVCLVAGGIYADPLGDPCLPVVDENVPYVVNVAGHEVGRI